MGFLHSFLRDYFVGKPVVLVQNVSGLFRLGFLGTLTASENHCLIIKGMMTIDIFGEFPLFSSHEVPVYESEKCSS